MSRGLYDPRGVLLQKSKNQIAKDSVWIVTLGDAVVTKYIT